MVARAWPVCVEVIQDWLLAAPSQRAHPHVSMTLLSWDIPLISFNGSLWDVLLRCSKWLIGAWLDSFTMILRCWLVVWVKWARPLVLYDTVIQYVQLKSVQLRGRPISWAVLHHWKSMGQFCTLLPPRGATFTPILRYGLTEPGSPLQMWEISHFCEIHSLSYEASKVFRNVKSMGQTLGRSCPPGVQLLPHFEVGSYRACQPLEIVANFTFLWNPLSELRGVKVFLMLSLCVFFCPYFAPGANIVPPIAYKVIAHDSRLGRTFWHRIHGSVTKLWEE